jgi:hypothetical protein
MRQRGASPIVAVLIPLALLVGCSRFASEKRIALRFTPKENVTANIPASEGLSASRVIDVLPLTDTRALSDRSLVGENREHSTAVPIRATSSVEEFATGVLRKCLGEWGVRLGSGDLRLRGEITNLLVTEDQTYSTAASIRFRLEDRAGMTLWEGIVMGEAHQWGSSFKEENYNEEISDALKRTYANLVSNAGFQRAWIGQRVSSAQPVAPADLESKILEMMKAGIGTEVIVGYVKNVKVSGPLSAEQILEWKKAGIPDAVLEAAVSLGPNRQQ